MPAHKKRKKKAPVKKHRQVAPRRSTKSGRAYYCRHCKRTHTKNVHRFHGKGSYKRTHK